MKYDLNFKPIFSFTSLVCPLEFIKLETILKCIIMDKFAVEFDSVEANINFQR